MILVNIGSSNGLLPVSTIMPEPICGLSIEDTFSNTQCIFYGNTPDVDYEYLLENYIVTCQ